MKIYVGHGNLESSGFKNITEPKMLEYIVDDSEATEIVFDNILRANFLQDVDKIIELAAKKLRSNGSITIIDIDFELLAFAFSKTGDIVQLNQAVINNKTPIRSFLTHELLNAIAQSKKLTVELVNMKNVEFMLTLRRVVNNGV
jgi:hypothetical protein